MKENPESIAIQAKDHDNDSSLLRDFLLPLMVTMGLIIVFLNVKHVPYEFSQQGGAVLRFVTKFAMTILLPLLLIRLLYAERQDFGIYFPNYGRSFKLAGKAFSVVGPAGLSFMVISVLGWELHSWPSAILLSLVYSLVLILVRYATRKTEARHHISLPNRKILVVAALSLITLPITYFTYDIIPVFWKSLYYVFIVGVGEELFFRGYLQSALNRYFGKPFLFGGVKFGWGMIIATAAFGLTHALVTTPPTWPWAVWTSVFGLSLGWIREKDGSVLAPMMLHAMADFPLVFFSN